MLLIWTQDSRGPNIAKVLELPTNGSNQPIKTLKQVELPDSEAGLPLAVLEKLYPAPKVME